MGENSGAANVQVSQVAEDYLKAIYKLRSEHPTVEVTTSALAEHLGVAPATVTGTIKRLVEMKLVLHTPYRAVELTESGLKIALEVVRHHRLIELYLHEALGYAWDEVHDEAEKLEHVMSEELEARMEAALGFPTLDPHGDPIPARDGSLPPPIGTPLSTLKPGQRATIRRVDDADPARLRYLGSLGLYPNAQVTLVEAAPFQGPLRLIVNLAEQVIDSRLAERVFVQPDPSE